MTTVLPFPIRPRFWPLRAYRAGVGEGPVVAVFFRVPVQRPQDETGAGDQRQGDDAAQQAVAEGTP